MTRLCSRDRVAAHFRARPGKLVSVLALVRLALCRYRQAISENRRRGMNIVHVPKMVKGHKESWYRWDGDEAA